MSVQPGTLAGKYEILGRLGDGGQGSVYKVRHLMLGEIRAVKVVQVEHAGDADDARMRLQREGRALARLRHPHIVTVHDLGEVDGKLFLEMDFIEGGDLTQYLGRRLPLEMALEITRQLADALHYAHSQTYVDASGASQLGMIHRDVKPSNVLVRGASPIDVLLTDFGLVKLEGFEKTVAGTMLGTMRYAAPEQLGWMRDGQPVPVDARCDVFSLGLLLYELVEGRSLHAGLAVSQVFARMVVDDADLVPTFHEDVPPLLQSLISRMLRRDPEDRPATMRTVLGEIDALQRTVGTDGDKTLVIADAPRGSGSPTSTPSVSEEPTRIVPRDDFGSVPERSAAPVIVPAHEPNRRRTVLVGATVAAGAGVVVLAIVLYLGGSPQTPAQRAGTAAVPAAARDAAVPARTADDVLASATQLLAGLPCAHVTAKGFGDGTLSVAGRVATDAQAGELERRLFTIPEVRRVDRDVTVVQTPFCDALDILEPVQGAGGEAGNRVSVHPSRGCDEVYHGGERLVVDVTSVEPSRYVYVDYYVADRQQVAHLLPNRDRPTGFLGAERTVRLGESHTAPAWEVSEPFGRELLTVVASSRPLFDAPRAQVEPAMPYVEALRKAIDHVDATASHCFLQTSEH